MVIEPRKVEPGFIRRWSSQSLELITRAFHVWFGFSVVICFITMALGWLPELAAIPLGIFACIASVEFAATADNQEVRLADIPVILYIAALGTMRDIWQKRWILLIVATYLLVQFYLGHSTKPSPAREAPPADLTNLLTWIATPDSPLMKAILVLLCGQMLQGHTAALGTLTHPLQRAFGVDESRARTLLNRAMFKNMPATAFLQVVPLIVLASAGLFLPIAAPFLMCFLPALSYVAFREMFIDDRGNREPAKQASSQPALQGIAS